jgi:hypothetical protein
MALLFMTSGLPQAMAASKRSVAFVPTITSLSVVQTQNGPQLTATGVVTATVRGKTVTEPFAAPVTVTAQPAQAGTCPVLDLTLGPIHVNLLGLDVLTSPICLTITADSAGGLLGQLLCSLGNLLNQGLTVEQALSGIGTQTTAALSQAQVDQLLAGLTNLLNQALLNLLRAILLAIQPGLDGACSILHLALGPLDLTLLGLNVHLDDCANGPVLVDITAIPGGGLLGDLLCQLLGGINVGATLQQILNQLLGLLNLP